MAKKKQLPEEVAHSEAYVKDFFDMVVPSTIKFNVDRFVCGDRTVSLFCIALSSSSCLPGIWISSANCNRMSPWR